MIAIRPYQPRDRSAVRTLACDTADRGRPLERFFADRDLAADLLTRYYTDDEPQASWIAEDDGHVIGYLTGCLDSQRCRRAVAWRIAPAAVLRGLCHRALWSARTWRLLVAAVRTGLAGGFRRAIPLDRYPAHLHVNVQERFRAQQVGTRFIERFLAQASEAGARGIHVSVRADNVPACRVFQRLGFTELSRHPAVFPDGDVYRPHDTIIYGKRL